MDHPQPVEQIGPETAVRLLAEGAAMIDVRGLQEWNMGRAPEAVHVPLGELAARVSELPTDRKLILSADPVAVPVLRRRLSSRGDCLPSTSLGGCRHGRPRRFL